MCLTLNPNLMKKLIFLSVILCTCLSVNAQGTEDLDDAVQGASGAHQQAYFGNWRHTTNSAFLNNTLSYSNEPDAYILITFTGNRIIWYTEKKNTHGIAEVSIDGGPEQAVNLYSETRDRVKVYESPNVLRQGVHTLKIRVSGQKDSRSTGTYIVHDNVVITQYDPPNELTDITNTRYGEFALHNIIVGKENTAIGYSTMTQYFPGTGNTAVGAYALMGLDKPEFGDHTAVGIHALSGGGLYGNTAVGAYAGPNSSRLFNCTAIGAYTATTADNQVRIGNSQVTSIGGQVSWSTLSDGRFKQDLKEDVSGLAFINGLRPVSYTVDNNAVARFVGAKSFSTTDERKKTPRQTGFVAQEVEALIKKTGYVFGGVDVPQNENDTYSIRYAEFVVPLVKAVQELSATVTAQQKEIDDLRRLNNKGVEKAAGWEKTELYQNNPNPFSVDTRIEMVIPDAAGDAKLLIYNLEGRQLKSISVRDRGETAVTIQGNELNAGMYLYTLIIDGQVFDTKRMILTE